MTETQLLRDIIGPKDNNLCDVLHWKGFHARPGMVWQHGKLVYRTPVQGGGTGFPDLVLASLKPWHPRPRVLFRELKSDTEDLSREQKWWFEVLKAARADVAVWRPRDWDEIEKTMRPPVG